MNISYFTNQLLHWYPDNCRELPWRNTKDPYIIWLSEIILQQTRVAQGLPYFSLFLERFPSVQDLASAPEEEILRCWQGLGYYSRARNLHACAKSIVQEHGGDFPQSYRELLSLKGVGPYTAAAIASFAFGQQVAVVDGNVFRVLGRYFGIEDDIGSSGGKKVFEKLANQLIPEDNPDIYNQAIMEFGALQCVPKNPDCNSCPLQPTCFAFSNRAVEKFPVKAGKTKTRKRFFQYFHIQCGKEVVINKRTGNDIWMGLVDFPLEEHTEGMGQDPDSSSLIEELKTLNPKVNFPNQKPYKHILSHQVLIAGFVNVGVDPIYRNELTYWVEKNGYSLVGEDQLETYGKPKLIVNYLNDQK
ncbi:A/G-specific adenine glycosylase [Lunatibacter salilacus]|uniref:A/G-specific adenine glycosylase n=1 Tax=Lunatibacter salilacus TaxID=2483804 RepID=UPI00131B1BB2|nr:A/G-specific adenine glycosylase [Lunatibacter salilacus]